MDTEARERFTFFQPLNRFADAADHAADQTELVEAEEWIADRRLEEEGGRRISDWTWEEFTDESWKHEAEIAELAGRVGQPWHPEVPDEPITEDDVRALREAGPQRYRVGKCWAVRA